MVQYGKRRGTPMRIAIVDDEQGCREELTLLLRAAEGPCGCRIELAQFPGAGEFLDALPRERFDLVFMDIFLEGLDGVAAAARLWESDKRCLLVFLTSSEEFRRDAFAVHAFDYLTKPVTPERVATLLGDALSVLPREEAYIEVVSGRKTVALLLRDIASVVTDAHYVDIGLADGAVVRSRMTIQEFLGLTGGDPRFLTINKGVVVNAEAVAQVEGACCVMENGARLPVRVRDRAQVEQAVRDYHITTIRGRQRHGQ